MSRAISNRVYLNPPPDITLPWQRILTQISRFPFALMGYTAFSSVTIGNTGTGGWETMPFDTVRVDTDGFKLDDWTVQIPENCGGWYVGTVRAQNGVATTLARLALIFSVNRATPIQRMIDIPRAAEYTTLVTDPVLQRPGDQIVVRSFTSVAPLAQWTASAGTETPMWSIHRVALPD